MKFRRSLTVIALLAVVASFVAVAAQARPMRGRGWVPLGDLRVSDRIDHDVLRVTRAAGPFRAIQIRVQGHPVQFHDVKVHYANGETQDVEVRDVIPAGGQSRAIDLTGRERNIKSIEFVYDAETVRRGRSARVRVFGQR
jgi:hypothetical protein